MSKVQRRKSPVQKLRDERVSLKCTCLWDVTHNVLEGTVWHGFGRNSNEWSPCQTTRILTLNTLGKIFSRRHIEHVEIFFLLYPENRIWHFMRQFAWNCQILFSGRNEKHISNLSSAEEAGQTFSQMAFCRDFLFCCGLADYLFTCSYAIVCLFVCFIC